MTACLCCNKTHSECKFGRHDQPDGDPCKRHERRRAYAIEEWDCYDWKDEFNYKK